MNIKKFLNKKIVAIAALTLAVVTAGVGSTVAYLKDSTQTLTNTFSVGSIETELVEVISGTTKIPYVLNVGKNNCLVRIRATVSPSEAGDLETLVDLNKNDWTYRDGYYYYNSEVAPYEKSAALFTKVDGTKIASNSSFEILIYQEAVQTSIYVDGQTYEQPETIWYYYDNGTFPALNE